MICNKMTERKYTRLCEIIKNSKVYKIQKFLKCAKRRIHFILKHIKMTSMLKQNAIVSVFSEMYNHYTGSIRGGVNLIKKHCVRFLPNA